MNGKIEFYRHAYQVVLPLAHLVPSPAHHRVIIDGQALVRHHQVLADAHHIPVAAARGAGSIRVVEAKEIRVRLLKGHAVRLKAVAELPFVHRAVGLLRVDHAAASTFKESRLHRLRHAGGLVVVATVHPDAVHHQRHTLLIFGPRGKVILNTHYGSLHSNTHKTLLKQHLQLRTQCMLLVPKQRGEKRHPRTLLVAEDIVHHIAHRVAFHLHAAHRRVGAAYAGIQQFQILVQLRLSAHRRARIVRVHLLLDGHCRRNILYQIHLRLGHTAKELACIARQAFYIAPLPLGIQRVESQARLARPAQSRYHHKLPLRYIHRDILQIIHPRTVYPNHR